MPSPETARRRLEVEGRRNLEDAVVTMPTPTASKSSHYDNGDGRSPLHLVPTPTARDGKGGDMPNREGGGSPPEAMALLPTPTAVQTNGTPQRYRERLAEHDGRGGSFLPLDLAVQLLPTPTASDAKLTSASGYPATATRNRGTTPTDAMVRGLVPTPKPSSDGSGSSADQPPTPPPPPGSSTPASSSG
jgi:hypothetical protein